MSDSETLNQQRWDRFRSDPDYDRVVEQILIVLEAAGLDRSTMGVNWGLTVHVDTKTFVRVNHADYALFDIRDPDLPLDHRYVVLAVLKMDDKKPGLLARAAGKLAGSTFERRPGFPKLISGSEVVSANFYDLPTMLLREDIKSGIKNHVEARPRKLYSVGRHNPLSVEIYG